MAVCPFCRYCPYLTNKKWQPNNVCYYFFIGKCTEAHKMYEKTLSPASLGETVEVTENA